LVLYTILEYYLFTIDQRSAERTGRILERSITLSKLVAPKLKRSPSEPLAGDMEIKKKGRKQEE
jgi:hypothetical protein